MLSTPDNVIFFSLYILHLLSMPQSMGLHVSLYWLNRPLSCKRVFQIYIYIMCQYRNEISTSFLKSVRKELIYACVLGIPTSNAGSSERRYLTKSHKQYFSHIKASTAPTTGNDKKPMGCFRWQLVSIANVCMSKKLYENGCMENKEASVVLNQIIK